MFAGRKAPPRPLLCNKDGLLLTLLMIPLCSVCHLPDTNEIVGVLLMIPLCSACHLPDTDEIVGVACE